MFLISTPRVSVVAVLSALLALTMAACTRQDEISTYEEPETPGASSTRNMPAKNATMPPVAQRLAYETPEGWSPGQAGGMRKAAFTVEKDGKKVDITVIDLSATAGALLPNINRWRQQIQLGELTEAEMEESIEEVPAAGVQGHFVELVGPQEAEPRQAILAIVALQGGKSWFFKLWGDPELALAEKERFLEFAKSLKFEAATSGDPHAGIPGMQAGMPGTAPPAAQADPGVKFTVPEGWMPARAQGMRKAVFLVRDENRFAEVTVIDLSASAGDLLANINRWRGQVNLEDITQEDLDKQRSPIQVAGQESHYVEMLGPEDAERPMAIFGVVVPLEDKTWFVKIIGDAEVVVREKDRFKGFAESMTFAAPGGEKNE